MKNIRLAIEIYAVRFATWFIPKLSRQGVIGLAWIVGAIAYLVDYRGRAAAHENLRAAFAKEHISAEQVRRIALASYQTFARTFLDLFWATSLTRESYEQWLNITFTDPADEAEARERGALWITPHFGNFEMMSLAMGWRGFKITVIAQDFKNPELTVIFTRLRQLSGHRIIPQEGALLRLMKELRRQGHAALLVDLNIRPNKTAAALNCFGLKTCVTTLHTNLASRLKLPVIIGISIPLADGSYRIKFLKKKEATDFNNLEDMAQSVWDACEAEIRAMPEAWLWMYKHWRYLPGSGPDPRYPDYANTNRAFQNMVKARKA